MENFMAQIAHRNLVCAGMVALLLGACSNDQSNAKPNDGPDRPASAAKGEKTAKNEPKGTKDAQKAPAPPAITTFPALSLDGLDPAAKAAFTQIANDEICPCNCPKSFAACLQAETKCQPAVLLAEWLVAQLRQGIPGELLAEAVSRELSGGFTAKAKAPDVTGYHAKGAPADKAKYTLVEYADFECAHCKAASPVLNQLISKYPGQIRVVFKHFPLTFHPVARQAAIAAEAAGEQGKFWEMHDAIFKAQMILDDELLLGHAKALGLDEAKFKAALKNPATIEKVDKSRKEGEALGIQSTPTFLVNGRPFNLMRSVDGFELRFAMEEARATSSCE
jgi:protein-disulfide isomerase